MRLGTRQQMTRKPAMVRGAKRGYGLVSITRADTLDSSRFMGKKPMNAGHEQPVLFAGSGCECGHKKGK